MRMLVGEMKSAIDEHEVSEGKVKPVNGTQYHFICATPECEGKLSEAARARQRCDPRFKPQVCTECYLKDATLSVGRNSSVPIVMQVSTAAPERKEWKRKETTGTWNAKLARQPVARDVTFSITVNPIGSDDVAPGEISTLSAQFESLEDEGEADDVGSRDGQSDGSRGYIFGKYVGSIERIRARLTPLLAESALSEVVALLDGFKDALADHVGDSPCTIFYNIATALFERGDSEGAEMAMREGIETREEGDNFTCYSFLAHMLAARGDLAEAESILLEGAAIEDKEGDGGDNCIEYLEEIKERHGDLSSLDQTVLLAEGASGSPPSTSTPHLDNGRFTTEEVTVGLGTGYDEETVQRDMASIEAVERAEADALLEWCEEPRVVASGWRPDEDSLLAAGVDMFPTGEAHRWRSIAEMVPGKNAVQCQSRARDETFIKAHRFSGEKKGTSAGEPSPDLLIRNGETDARLAELIIALPGGRDKPDGAERTAQPEPDLDDKGECVVLSGAEDDSFNGEYYRSYTEERKPWEVGEDGLICYRHTSNDSESTYLWLLASGSPGLGGSWGCAFESYFNERGNVFKCKMEIVSPERDHAHPAQVRKWHTTEWLWDPVVQTQVPTWTRNGSIKVERG